MNAQLSERLMWTLLGKLGRVDGYLDINSGDGVRVRTVRSTGIRPSLGIAPTVGGKEESIVPDSILVKDTKRRFDLENIFELVTCVEGLPDASIESERMEVFIGNLTRHSEKWLVTCVPTHEMAGVLKDKHFALMNEFDVPYDKHASARFNLYVRTE